jgi:hypothetical protein
VGFAHQKAKKRKECGAGWLRPPEEEKRKGLVCGLRPHKDGKKKMRNSTFFWKKESGAKKTSASGPAGRWKNRE